MHKCDNKNKLQKLKNVSYHKFCNNIDKFYFPEHSFDKKAIDRASQVSILKSPAVRKIGVVAKAFS